MTNKRRKHLMKKNITKRTQIYPASNSSSNTSLCTTTRHLLRDLGFPPISLQNLPEETLQLIFSYLNPADLLTLCSLSKRLYYPAINCLYQRIIITDSESKHVRADAETWTSRKFTVTCRPGSLVESISKNPRLALLIETIIVHNNREKLWLPLTRLCKRLKEFHNRGDEIYEYINSVPFVAATVHVKTMPILGPYLREVRFVYSNDALSSDFITRIAFSMIHTKAYLSLRTLIFDHENPREYGATSRWSRWPQWSAGYPCWIRFFAVYWDANIKLNLETLGLDGCLRKNTRYIASRLHSALNVTKLKTLQLKYNEDPHPESPHDDELHVEPCFLEYLTRNTKSLINLYIDSNIRCDVCAESSMLNATKNIKDQLVNLYLRTLPPENFYSVLKAITDCQYYLAKLEIKLINPCFNIRKSIPNLHELLYLSGEQSRLILHRHYYTPWFDFTKQCRLYVSEIAETKVRSNMKTVPHFLRWNYIYECRQDISEHLVEYCVDGFRLDLRNHELLLNDSSIDLDPYTLPPPHD